MFRKISYALKNRKGFTLVELMVVVVIIGVLSAIAVPLYNNQTETARLNAHMTNIKIIESAVQQYKAVEGVSTYTDTAAVTDNATLAASVLKGYIQDWPSSPGTYSLSTGGVLTANPTKAATQTAMGGGSAVTWP